MRGLDSSGAERTGSELNRVSRSGMGIKERIGLDRRGWEGLGSEWN